MACVRTHPSFCKRGPLFCKSLQRYDSPADWARKLFKPPTDSASLLVENEKNFFSFWVWGFLLVTQQLRLVFAFLTNFTRPWAPIQKATVLTQFFLETRWSSASLEPLIDLLPCLEPELWLKNPILHKNQKIAEKAWVSH